MFLGLRIIFFSTQNHVTADITTAGIPVFGWERYSEEEFNWCIEQTLFFVKDRQSLNMILDDDGDLMNIVFDGFSELIAGMKELSEENYYW